MRLMKIVAEVQLFLSSTAFIITIIIMIIIIIINILSLLEVGRLSEVRLTRPVRTRDVIDSRQVDAPLGMTLSIVASIRQPYRCGRIDKI